MSDDLNTIDIIKERINELNISPKKFIYLVRSTPIVFEKVLNRETNIDIDILYRIARYTEMEPFDLIKNEYYYRKKNSDYTKEYNKISSVYKELVDRKLVPKTDNIIDIVNNYKKFMEIGDISILDKLFSSFKKYKFNYKDNIDIVTWSQIALRKVRDIDFSNIEQNNEKTLERLEELYEKSVLKTIDMKRFKNSLIEICKDNGVFLNIEKGLGNDKVISYSKILNNGIIVLQVVDSDDVSSLFSNVIREYYLVTKRNYLGDRDGHFYIRH